MIWGNAIPDFSHVATTHINRQDTLTYQQTVPSQGWGYCGTAAASGCQAAGTCPSNWDQNGSNGYACLDQPGRGQGDLLTGLNNVSGSTKTNSVTGCTASQPCAWPRERLEPVYEWNDTWSCPGCGGSFWSDYDPGVLKNRDYFLGSDGTASCPANPAGNCTAGVGTGTFANRPASCTANSTAYPAGNSPGVGYWATDQNTLYVCTATNTWTVYYKPYTYPHPLQSTL